MQEFTKKDWTLFRNKVVDWQEVYMDKLNKEYIELLSGDAAPSDKFWILEKRIKADRKRPGVILEMRRSQLVYNLLSLIRDDVIGLEDLDEFSDDLRGTVSFLVQRWNED